MTSYAIVERPERDQLGETPFWDEETQTLFWCDIVGKEVRRLDPSSGAIERWPMPDFCSGIVPTTDGHATVKLMDGVYRTDPQGRLWLGTMGNNIGPNGENVKQPGTKGSIFCIDGRGFSRRVLGGIGITNTFCWSPDGGTFYTADTSRRVIWSFRYDADNAVLHDRKVLVEGDVAPGNPDGAAMDEDGCLWGARWGGSRLVRYTPDGRVDRTIELPAKQPSSCAFGGRDRRTLYVTSARQEQKDLPPDALDGSLFAVELDVAGLPMPRFKLG